MIIKLGLFTLIALVPLYAFAAPGTATVDINGVPVELQYDAEGLTINNVQADLDFVSLIFDVDVTGSPGILEITFDRSVFDSKFEGVDDDFIIIADGDLLDFEETQTSEQSRTLRIELPTGTAELEIIGTEFGSPTPAEEPAPETPAEETIEVPAEVTETPVEEPAPEAPAEEPAPEGTSEAAVTEKPKVVCGPGTYLKDGVCVLDERCGPGTILKDGVCVLNPAESKTLFGQGTSKELLIGAIAAFLIALAVITILYLISRGSRQRNKQP